MPPAQPLPGRNSLPVPGDASFLDDRKPAVPLAVIGFACRLPGGVSDGPSYWRLLAEGRDAVTEVPPDRWNAKAFSGRPGLKGKSASRWGGFLDQIDLFEPACFGISPREAHHIDPQQRLLLEMTVEALEHAGLPAERLAGSRTGVFVGVSTGDYGQIQRGPHSPLGLGPFTAQGCSLSIAANRISYCFDLRGPSFIVDTACSSSLIAFDRAAKSLREGESDLAVVGGVNVIINPETFISFSQASMLSPDGRCKAFDASANGFVRAEGGGAFLLKRLDEALRDGDPVRGIVLGTGANQDGRTGGLAMPNPDAQEALLREVYRNAAIDPAAVRYVEAHGTGTAVGDPSEAEALGRVFGPGRPADGPLIIGSCKTNLGHLEAASGVASLCKVLLMFEHRQIPPSLHFTKPNPRIAFDRLRLRVPTGLEAWPDDRPAVVGVNSFGFGGANAHVILGEYRPEDAHRGNGNGTRLSIRDESSGVRDERRSVISHPSSVIPSVRRGSPDPAESATAGLQDDGRPAVEDVARSGDRATTEDVSSGDLGLHYAGNGHAPSAAAAELPLVLTARSEPALRELARRWTEWLPSAEQAGIPLSDIAFTAANRRSRSAHRLGLVATDFAQAREQLEAFVAEESRPLMHVGETQPVRGNVGRISNPSPKDTVGRIVNPSRGGRVGNPTSSEEGRIENPSYGGGGVAFVFCGQGPQWHGMGRELFDREPVFRDTMEEIDRLLRDVVGWSLIEELSRDEDDSRIHLTSVAQPALFAVQVALARLWQSWGVEPAAVVGHSVGEIAAAHVAGLLSLETAVRIIGHRGLCLEAHALPGRMIAAALTEDQARQVLAEIEPLECGLQPDGRTPTQESGDRSQGTGVRGQESGGAPSPLGLTPDSCLLPPGSQPAVCLAAVNSPKMVTLSGEIEAVERLGERLTEMDVWWKPLRVRHAFHSHLVEDARRPFLERIGEIEEGEPISEMVCTAGTAFAAQGEEKTERQRDGETERERHEERAARRDGATTGPAVDSPVPLSLRPSVSSSRSHAPFFPAEYWWDNIRRPVRFADAVQTLRERGCSVFLEVGPHPVLGASIKQCRRPEEAMPAVFPSLVREEPERRAMLAALVGLCTQGVEIDWPALWPQGARVVELPPHPWLRERFWHEDAEVRRGRLQPEFHPLLGHDSPGAQRVWQNSLNLQDQAWLQDHRAGGQIIFPAAGFVELLLAAGSRVLKSDTLAVDDVMIQRGLFLSPDAIPTTQVAADADAGLLTIASRMNETDEVWTKPAQATFRPLPASVEAAPLDIAAWKADAEPVSAEAFYETFRRMGLDYGPAFRGVRELHRRDKTALGRIELEGELAEQSGDYLAHPALLDSCFQVLLEAIPPESRQLDRMFLPERIGRIYFRRPPGARAWSEVRLKVGTSMRVVGDIRIFTEAGEPAIEVLGFECRAMMSSRERSGDFSPHERDIRSCLYQTRWDHQPLPETPVVAEPLVVREPLVVPELVAAADAQARGVWHDESPRSVIYGLLRHDRLALAYLVEALRQMGLTLRAGEAVNPQQWIDAGTLIERHRPLVERCLDRFVAAGQAEKRDGQWAWTTDLAAPDIAAEWRETLAAFPESYPHLRLIELCGADLADVLCGKVDPLELLFSDEANELLEQVYRDQPWARYGNTFIQQLCLKVAAGVPEHRPIRILEVGAGLGGTAACVLPVLPAHRVEYWFTDVSPFFLTRAEDRFRRYEFVRYRRFDVEQDPTAQDIPLRAFDIVIAADVLHATGDLRAAVQRCGELLTDGGLLALRELTRTRPSFDLVFGLMDGWWNYRGDTARSDSALLTRSQWTSLLAETDFEQPSTPATCDETQDYAAVIVARQPQRDARCGPAAGPGDPRRTDKAPAEKNWLVFADRNGEGARLADRLRGHDRRCVVVSAGGRFERLAEDEFRIDPGDPEDMRRLREESGLRGDLAVVHLWSADIAGLVLSPDELDDAEARVCHSVMHLLQTFAASPDDAPRRLVLVTRGARDLPADGDASRAVQGALVGLGRVAANEYRQVSVRLVDLDPTAGPDDEALWAEIVADNPQAEVAWRGPHRLVPRLEHAGAIEPWSGGAGSAGGTRPDMPPFRLHIAKAGDLSSMELCEIEDVPVAVGRIVNPSVNGGRRTDFPVRPDDGPSGSADGLGSPSYDSVGRISNPSYGIGNPSPGEVQIDVHFVALNFRDVLKALSQYPAEDAAQLEPGDECTGIVRAVGEGVTHLKPGDRVVACTVGCFRSVLTTSAARVTRIPDRLSLSAAATMPVAYVTVNHALRTVGKLAAGESLLIHSAAGGVGMAALQVARSLGADIYATAGSDAKRSLLTKYGVRRVMNSRGLDFYDEILAATDGRGVDAVLNSLAGQAMSRSLACVAPWGRFLELGKRDFYENTRIGLFPFRHNVSYHAIDLSAILGEEPTDGISLVSDLFDDTTGLPPLPMRVMPVARLQDAFRLMGQGGHIGKIVIDMTQHWGFVRRAERTAPVRPDATYLITGAFGGVGLEVAHWLADRGARHLVMLSRSGPATDAARGLVETLQAEGVNVHPAACDVTDPAALEELLTEVRREMPPLAGVFHLAMVIDDAVLSDLNRERFAKVMRPKVHGGWHLHRLTSADPLEMFVLFSSVSAAIGNYGQANYAAANAALESLAAHRRSLGLPATAIGWGMLGEAGYVAERQELGESLQKLGFSPMSMADVRDALDAALTRESAVTIAVRTDWHKLGQWFRSAQQTPGLISALVAAGTDESEGTEGLRESIAAADPDERPRLIENFVKARVARVLGMSPQKIESGRPLSEMGLDSLMAVELASIVESELGASVPVSALSRDVTIEKLSATLLRTLVGTGPEDATTPGRAEPQDDRTQCLVPLREGQAASLPMEAGSFGHGPAPLFCFHPAGGGLEIYEHLVLRLAGDFPIYGLKRTNDTAASLRELADEYAAAIAERQPDGPVRLFGFSLGGMLAVRTAARLQELGREVEFVGVVECNPGGLESDEARRERMACFLCETYELIRRETGFLEPLDAETLEREARRAVERLDAQAVVEWFVDGGHIVGDMPRSFVEDYLTGIGRDLALMAEDAGTPDGTLTAPLHVWSAAGGLGAGIDVWHDWTAGTCSHTVLDGEHFSVMYPPHVGELAEQLSAALQPQPTDGEHVSVADSAECG